ncbi:SNF2 helicase associated domain-containing protein [Cytobacillus sp. FJAT-54145]|uniref:SNF2 helicase associated domain-containing protein n=1 Tax=Cytobacillus spartinae TaxID=3299023 RepID=A0ABW6K7H2_9BACI
MNIKLTLKMIQDMCGTVSFKRGDAFYRTKKVDVTHYSNDVCEAIVKGTEDFAVTIHAEGDGGFQATCSCPKLASFSKECQHIAAVLLSIYEKQRKGTSPAIQLDGVNSSESDLTEGLLTLFKDQSVRSSGHQLHFEDREVLDVTFTCRVLTIGNGQNMFGIEAQLGSTMVTEIRDFLLAVKSRESHQIGSSFLYNPISHCFQKETDGVLHQLIQVIYDEKAFINTLVEPTDYIMRNQMLLIPPSSWERLLPFLVLSPSVKLEYGEQAYQLTVTSQTLPLQFHLEERTRTSYGLIIKGMDRLVLMNSYHSVLSAGKIVSLNKEDSKRLFELNQMLNSSRIDEIPIHQDQLPFFIEKVIPGLKRLGNVQVSHDVSKEFMKTPLKAKLYLDRVKNRLLAGVEFHYDHVVINPLESRELSSGPLVIRDVEKEDEILQLMDESQFTKTDGGYILQNEELEYEFLYHTVPKLQKLVQIYATTAIRNRIFRENAKPRIRVKVKKERTNWLEFKFELDGIKDIDIRDLLAALEEKRKYFRLKNGSLLSLESREYEEIQRFLKTIPVQPEDIESQFELPFIQGFSSLSAFNNQDLFKIEESFKQFLDQIFHPEQMNIEIPDKLEQTLRDYQKHGYKWMKTLASYGFGGVLADDMGLGKTLQSITFILSELHHIREKKKAVLIVCPASLSYNWLSEIMKFTPEIEAIVIDGSQKERQQVQQYLDGVDVIITTYPLLRKDLRWYENQSFHTVFFDEAQAFKNPVTQTARAVKKLKADHRFALTGTPVENSIEELWSIFHVVFPELFQGLREYSHLTRETISRRIRPFLLRRLKEDVLSELPDKLESLETMELLPEQKKLYAAYLAKLRHDTLKHLDKDTLRKNKIRILAGLTRLRQICCHPALFVDSYKGRSAKFEQLVQILEECRLSGRRVLIFSQFTKMLEMIGRHLALQGQSFFYLDGQTPSEQRVQLCNRFNEGEHDFFLISLKAGGTGLNLTGADTVIMYDLWWNPAVEEQATDRAHRIGQDNTVQVIKLVTRGTIEEKMNELQEKKKHLIKEILDPAEKGSATLTEEDIRELLMI